MESLKICNFSAEYSSCCSYRTDCNLDQYIQKEKRPKNIRLFHCSDVIFARLFAYFIESITSLHKTGAQTSKTSRNILSRKAVNTTLKLKYSPNLSQADTHIEVEIYKKLCSKYAGGGFESARYDLTLQSEISDALRLASGKFLAKRARSKSCHT